MATSSRPGPVLVEVGCVAEGSGSAFGSDMDNRPDLMQPDHEYGRDQPGHGGHRRAPAGSFQRPPERRGHGYERDPDQISDEHREVGRVPAADEPGHDHADQDQ